MFSSKSSCDYLLLSASTHFIYSTCSFCLCELYPTPSRNSLVFIRLVCFFRSSYVGWRFFCYALVPGTLALDLPTLILQRGMVFLSHCLWPQNLYLSTMKHREGHWGYCWLCRWVGRTNGLMWSFSLSHSLWPHNLYLSTMKNQEGHWGYCWCR